MLREAVRELRHSIRDPQGNPTSQTEFGRLIGKSLNTVQRYETLVPPKGAVLLALAELAIKHDQLQIAAKFVNAFDREMLRPQTWAWRLTMFPQDDFERFLVCGLLTAMRGNEFARLRKTLVRLLFEPARAFMANNATPEEVEAFEQTFQGFALDLGYVRTVNELYKQGSTIRGRRK